MKRQVGAVVAVLTASAALVLSPTSVSEAGEPGPAPRASAANGRIALTEPDPTKPAYVRSPQVWTANPDGSDVHRQFAAIDESNAFPQWSPDGRWLAFYRDNTLMVARADGTEAHVAAPGTGYIGASRPGPRTAPASPTRWSPSPTTARSGW